ncbi:phage holin family protein [bacterium]|nr:phage holin family protein [bacterium]
MQTDPTTLVNGAFEDAKKLVALETQLFKLELQQQVQRIVRVAALFAVALALLLPAGILSAMALASTLAQWAHWPDAAAQWFVAAAFALGAASAVGAIYWTWHRS